MLDHNGSQGSLKHDLDGDFPAGLHMQALAKTRTSIKPALQQEVLRRFVSAAEGRLLQRIKRCAATREGLRFTARLRQPALRFLELSASVNDRLAGARCLFLQGLDLSFEFGDARVQHFKFRGPFRGTGCRDVFAQALEALCDALE